MAVTQLMVNATQAITPNIIENPLPCPTAQDRRSGIREATAKTNDKVNRKNMKVI